VAAEVGSEAVADEGQAGLGLQGVVGVVEGAVGGVHGLAQGGFGDVGVVDGVAGQAFVEDVGGQVQDPLAEAAEGGGAAVVDDVGGQDGDPLAAGAAVAGLQVVADPAVVHDEHRPGVVDVRGIGVVDEAGVEDLVHARDHRLPGPDPLRSGRLSTRRRHDRIVQDRDLPAVVHFGA
jgi:hypothetical protein